MSKITVDFSGINNQITQIYNEAFTGIQAKNDNERRDILLKVVEKLRGLKNKINDIELEVK